MEDTGTLDSQATLGGTEQEPATPEPAPVQEQAEYVVQVHAMDDSWVDIATVTVPPRTRRKSVLEKVLADSPEHGPTADEPKDYRVLDAQSFEWIPATLQPPVPADPVLRIG